MTSPYLRRPIRTIDQALADLEAQADELVKIEYEDVDITVLVFEDREELEQRVTDSMGLPSRLIEPDGDEQ